VYDPFLGSGSTLIAAEQTQRRCLGMEIAPEYCRVVMDRFQKLTGIAPVKLSPARHD
jgi:DNA modification methylase